MKNRIGFYIARAYLWAGLVVTGYWLQRGDKK